MKKRIKHWAQIGRVVIIDASIRIEEEKSREIDMSSGGKICWVSWKREFFPFFNLDWFSEKFTAEVTRQIWFSSPMKESILSNLRLESNYLKNQKKLNDVEIAKCNSRFSRWIIHESTWHC